MDVTATAGPGNAGSRAARWVSRWWLDRSVLAKGLTVVAIPMLALVAVAGAGLLVQLQERGERSDARAANRVASASRAVLADAVDAETGMRGYAVSADLVFLAPYTAALTQLAGDLRQLRQTATSEHLQTRADTVAATVTEQLALLAQLRSAVAAGSPRPQLTSSLTAAAALMDRLRTQAGALADEPTKVAVRKRNAITRLENIIEAVQWAGLGLGVLSGLVGIALFTTGISRRVRLAAINAELLGQGQPLRPGPAAGDELGELGESLTRANLLLDTRLEQLSTARDHALRATHAKNTFLSRTSHELRTPLNAILGFAQLLEVSELTRDDRDAAAHINAAGRHLLQLINDLIDTALIEAGELRLSVEPVSVHRLSQDIAHLIEPLAAHAASPSSAASSTTT
jgi:CHASE3 domain sensor protein